MCGWQRRLDFGRQSVSVILLFAVILGMLAFDLHYGRRTRRELLVPMEEVTRDMRRIGDSAPRPDGTQVGLAGIRRLLELMYDRKNLFVLTNAEPHGAMSRACIPAHPVHENRPGGGRTSDA